MKSQIKAINTEYNGYLFRSRLEARWAVFFDNIGIEYVYELEGYQLSNNVMYLPDFYLPSIDIHVEIKPSFDTITNQDIKKIVTFSSDCDEQLLLVIGVPSEHSMYMLNKHHIECYKDIDNPDVVSESGSLLNAFENTVCSYPQVDFSINPITGLWGISYVTLRDDYSDCQYRIAMKKAKQARFEYKKH